MIIESWYKIWCPDCQTPNWACDGDPLDCTGEDLEVIECFHCKKKFCFYDNLIEEIYGYAIEGDEDNPPMTKIEIIENLAHCRKGRENTK